MPGGYLKLVAIIGLYTGLVLWPPRRPRALAAAVYFVSHPVNELPGLALIALLAARRSRWYVLCFQSSS